MVLSVLAPDGSRISDGYYDKPYVIY